MVPRVPACLLAPVLLGLAAPLAAQATIDTATATRALAASSAEIATVDRALDAPIDRAARTALRDRLNAARTGATTTAATLETQLALVDARIAQLGPAPDGTVETADIRAQRRLLAQQRSMIDSGVKRGRLLGVEAQQLVDEIDAAQAERLGEQVTTRSPSPLAPDFWAALLRAAPRDSARGLSLVVDGVGDARRGLAAAQPWTALGGLVLALLLLFPIRLALRSAGRKRVIAGAPGHRVRRSGYALWRVTVGTALPGLAALAFVQGLRWSGLVPPRIAPLADALVVAAFVAAFVNSLAGTLLLRGQASWRLLPIGDATAQALRPWSWLLTGLALVMPLVEAFARTAGASAAAHVATTMIEALLYLVLLAGTLLTIGRQRARQEAAGEEEATPARAGTALLALAAWGIVIVALIAVLAGYGGLALFLVRMTAWTAIMAGLLYLLLVATDDLATTIFSSTSGVGETLHRGLGLRRSTIDQFGVLLSGAVRLLFLLFAVAILLTPFGAGVGSLFDRLGVMAQGIDIGAISISPWGIVRAILVLAIGMALVRLFQRWLTGRYLPATDLDGSAQNSISLVARYVGLALVVVWTLASLGIGVERIALLLSALSVGIGFGLQAITQNFVSGLILLAERPVKIGDLVRIGTDEGDVRRISVRSTEIELADHSTLIVPNSELITKTVLNKTHASPLGRVQLQFSVPLGDDAAQVRAIVDALFAERDEVLTDPEPKVFIDGIADGRILFNCFAHVASPRTAYPVRSALLFELLRRLDAAGIDIGTVPQKMELHPVAGTPPLPQPKAGR